MAFMIPIVAIIGSFTAAILISFFAARARQRRAEVQADVQTKLIDRFGSAPELVQFLQSPSGRQFISGATTQCASSRERILSGFRRAIILTVLGAAFAFLTYYEDRDFIVVSVILIALGIGYFAATLLTYRLTGTLQVPELPSDPQTPRYTQS